MLLMLNNLCFMKLNYYKKKVNILVWSFYNVVQSTIIFSEIINKLHDQEKKVNYKRDYEFYCVINLVVLFSLDDSIFPCIVFYIG